MTRVFQAYSRLKIPLADVHEAISTDGVIELPEGVEDLELERVNDRLQIQSVAADESLSRYTPTAMLKGSITEKRVVVTDAGDVTHESVSEYRTGSGWVAKDEDELETEEVTYLELYGRGDEVLVHKQLRSEMFDVLCQLAEESISGYVEGILLEDEDLTPVVYEAGGEELDAEILIDHGDMVEDESGSTEQNDDSDTLQWSQTQ